MFVVLLCLAGFQVQVLAQGWAAKIDGAGDDFGQAGAVDTSGGAYFGGMYDAGSVQIYDSQGVSRKTMASGGLLDGYIAKYHASNGSYIWAATQTGSTDNHVTSVTTDWEDSVYVCGPFRTTISVYDAFNVVKSTLTIPNSGGTAGLYAVKYRYNGTFEWALKINSATNDYCNDIHADKSGVVYISGYCGNSCEVYDAAGTLKQTLPSEGGFGGFVCQYNFNGTYNFAVRQGHPDYSQVNSVETGTDGSFYVAGHSQSTLKIYDRYGTLARTLTMQGTQMTYLVKYLENGTYQWALQAANGADMWCSVNAFDNVYISGYYQSSALTIYDSIGKATTVAASGTGAFLSKVLTNGSFSWGAKVVAIGLMLYSVDADDDEGVVIGGSYWDQPLTAFHSNGITSIQNSVVTVDGAFIVKYLSNGTASWIVRLNGGTYESVYEVFTDRFGNIYATGNTNSNSLSLYDGNQALKATLTKSGTFSAFVVKYSSDGTWNYIPPRAIPSSVLAATVTQISSSVSTTTSVSTSAVLLSSSTVSSSSSVLYIISSSSQPTSSGSSEITSLLPTSTSLTSILLSSVGVITSQLSTAVTSSSLISTTSSHLQSQPGSSTVSTQLTTSSSQSFTPSTTTSSNGPSSFTSSSVATLSVVLHSSSVMTQSTYLQLLGSSSAPSSTSTAVPATSTSSLTSASSISTISSGTLSNTQSSNGIAHSSFTSTMISSDSHVTLTTSNLAITTLHTSALLFTQQNSRQSSVDFVSSAKLVQITVSVDSSMSYVSPSQSFGLQPITFQFPSQRVQLSRSITDESQFLFQQQSPQMFLLIGVGAAIIFSLMVAMCVYFWCRYRELTNTKSVQHKHSVTDTVESTQFSSSMTTQFVTNTELAVPAFLELQFAVDFRALDVIAKGGAGFISHCKVLDSQKLTAKTKLVVKNLGRDIDSKDSNFNSCFYQEIALLYMLRGKPFFAAMYGYTTRPATIILKYYQYGSLKQYAVRLSIMYNQFGYSKLQVLSIIAKLSQGFAYLHQKNYAHCDIKPDNILLEASDGLLIPAISDFGISRMLDQAALKVKAFQISSVKGLSVAYAAPESLFRFRNKVAEVNPAVFKAGDVYSFAIVMMEVLNRKQVYECS